MSSGRPRAARPTAAMRDERLAGCSQSERGADRNHGRAAGVDDVDDFGVVDALEVDRGDAEVAVAELALDDDERNALVGHLDGVGVAELVGREASANAGGRGAA